MREAGDLLLLCMEQYHLLPEGLQGPLSRIVSWLSSQNHWAHYHGMSDIAFCFCLFTVVTVPVGS